MGTQTSELESRLRGVFLTPGPTPTDAQTTGGEDRQPVSGVWTQWRQQTGERQVETLTQESKSGLRGVSLASGPVLDDTATRRDRLLLEQEWMGDMEQDKRLH